MRNIRLTLQYEGTRYQGWQRQETSENTIQGKLERLLTQMCGEQIEIQASGRTDAGVHAKGQVANFHTNAAMSTEEMLSYINSYLPADIAVVAVSEAAPRFHSRLNAAGKCYHYQVWNSAVPNVFLRNFALEVQEQLDVEAMRRAAEYLTGEHDFKAFTSARKSKKSTVRRIDDIEIQKEGDLLTFSFRGNGFLYHMVRILVGTLLEVGSGKRSPESVKKLLTAESRQYSGALVPAKGLTLMEVYY